jgi:hypothetical protein
MTLRRRLRQWASDLGLGAGNSLARADGEINIRLFDTYLPFIIAPVKVRERI